MSLSLIGLFKNSLKYTLAGVGVLVILFTAGVGIMLASIALQDRRQDKKLSTLGAYTNNNRQNKQTFKPMPTVASVRETKPSIAPIPSPTPFILTPTPNPSPKPIPVADESYKQEVMLNLVKKIAERYAGYKFFVSEIDRALNEYEQCLLNQINSVCDVYMGVYNGWMNSLSAAEKDVREWKSQLQDMAFNCSTCLPFYQESLKMFEKFELDARSGL